MTQPTLHKPKSKLRLRLGLTPPYPKPVTTKPPPLPIPDVPAPVRVSSLNVSTHTDSLSSTATSTTTTSRPDSRSLFIYDTTTSPSTQGEQVIQTSNGLTFDTISYASTSPASGRFDRAMISSPHRNIYPTPPTSGYDSDMADNEMEEIDVSFLEAGEGQDHRYKRTIIKASADVIKITDKEFYQRFELRKKLGHGNWGAVYQAKPLKPKWAYLSNGSLTPKQRAVSKLGTASAASGGGMGGRVALKMVPLKSGDPCDAARFRALWGEMKVVRLLRQEPHPSIIQFEAFIVSDTVASIIMPYLSHLVQVCLRPEVAIPYFRQLASAVGYLHERGITHNDIKPANVMISHNNIPVLVDFGFAHYWPMDERDTFWSEITWGTPEYLDPHRAQGLWHDERASDVWSLGITFFEILTGRTPFELDTDHVEDEDEDYIDPARYAIYIQRSLAGVWLGEWSIPEDLTHLLENMIRVDPAKRITAMQAYHHPSLQPNAPSVLVTPQFIRDAVSFETDEPVPTIVPVKDKEAEEKPRRKKKTTNKGGARSVTPALPLGESIKQHTSAPRGKKGDKETPSPVKKGSRLVIKKMRSDDHLGVKGGDEEDITPTKIVKPAQPLKTVESHNKAEKTLISRPSHRDLARPASRTLLNKRDSNMSTGTASARSSIVTKEHLAAKTKSKTLSHRTSNLSTLSTVSTVPAHGEKDEDTARLRTMQSLEGNSIRSISTTAGGKKRDVLAAISRPAPEPPRPVSVDFAQVSGTKEKEVRRSLGSERVLDEVKEVQESPAAKKTVIEPAQNTQDGKDKEPDAAFQTVPRHKQPVMAHVGSPPKKRLAKPAVPDPMLDAAEDRSPPRRLAFTSTAVSPRSAAKEAMMTEDQDKLGRFRQISGDLVPAQVTPSAAIAAAAAAAAITEADEARGLQHRKSIEALALDNRLDKISEWVKTVESIVDQARKAIAEGRDIPATLLTLPMPTDMTLPASLPTEATEEAGKEFGVTPEKSIPVHLRTSSTQVEPATPPKWMTYAEAEERIKKANAWMEDGNTSRPASALSMGEVKRISGKKERGSVSNVLKIFGAEKEKEKSGIRSPTPQPDLHVPLKPPAPTLRATPSVPMLRSDSSLSGGAAAQSQRIPARKSESNLRAFNTLPTSSRVTFSELVQQSAFSDDEDDEIEEYTSRVGRAESPRSPRRLYERFLDSTPGVVRQGDGWSSLSSGKGLAKPSSMASLRERARVLLHGDTFATAGNNRGRNIVDPSANTDRRQSKQNLTSTGPTARPTTPRAASVLTAANTTTGGQKGWGIWKGLKGLGKKGKGMEKVDEA